MSKEIDEKVAKISEKIYAAYGGTLELLARIFSYALLLAGLLTGQTTYSLMGIGIAILSLRAEEV